MEDDAEKPPVRTSKTFHPVVRPRSTSDGNERALEHERRQQQEVVARQRQEELRIRMEAEQWLAGRSAEERDIDAFCDKFDQVVEGYLRAWCKAMPGFSLRPLIVPLGSRSNGYVFGFDGKTGWIHHPNHKTVLVERVSLGRRSMERTLVKVLTVDELTTKNVGKAVKEVLGIRKRRGAADRRS